MHILEKSVAACTCPFCSPLLMLYQYYNCCPDEVQTPFTYCLSAIRKRKINCYINVKNRNDNDVDVLMVMAGHKKAILSWDNVA